MHFCDMTHSYMFDVACLDRNKHTDIYIWDIEQYKYV